MATVLERLVERFRRRPVNSGILASAALLVLILGRFAWVSGRPATWLEVSPDVQMVAGGATQQVKVALKHRPRFRSQASARPIAAKIQLLSFPEAVVVAPTTIETTAGAPEAVFTVRGLKRGVEELAFAGSEDPPDPASWRVNSMKAAVAAAKPVPRPPVQRPPARRR